jgi:hypothetical protein
MYKNKTKNFRSMEEGCQMLEQTEENGAEEMEEDAGPMNDELIDPATLLEREGNPWPYVNGYFSFIGQRDRSLDYQCLACMPRIVDIKAHVTSLNNLKLHMLKHHPELSDQFHYVIKQCSGRGKGKNRWGSSFVFIFWKKSRSYRIGIDLPLPDPDLHWQHGSRKLAKILLTLILIPDCLKTLHY